MGLPPPRGCSVTQAGSQHTPIAIAIPLHSHPSHPSLVSILSSSPCHPVFCIPFLTRSNPIATIYILFPTSTPAPSPPRSRSHPHLVPIPIAISTRILIPSRPFCHLRPICVPIRILLPHRPLSLPPRPHPLPNPFPVPSHPHPHPTPSRWRPHQLDGVLRSQQLHHELEVPLLPPGGHGGGRSGGRRVLGRQQQRGPPDQREALPGAGGP